MQFGHARFVYNHFLKVRQARNAARGEGLRYHDTTRMLTALKRAPDHKWLQAADTQVLQQRLKDLEHAFVNFFDGRARFRSRRDRQSIRYPQRVKVDVGARCSRLPSLWSRSYYAGAIGQVSEDTVKRYIETQKGK